MAAATWRDPSIRSVLGGSLAWEELRGDYSAASARALERRAASTSDAERAAFDVEDALIELLRGRPGAARARLLELIAGGALAPAAQTYARLLIFFADDLRYQLTPGGASRL